MSPDDPNFDAFAGTQSMRTGLEAVPSEVDEELETLQEQQLRSIEPRWDVDIGMEVHVQPTTRSKMFCGCAVAPLNAAPNTFVCEVCLGLPGVLPTINRAAIEACIKTAHVLACDIPPQTRFDRKNYMYPDLPKGYQISQYDLPLARWGHLRLGAKKVQIRRVHLEEDTGRLVHAGDKLRSAWESYVDLNRAGVPLMEIVSEPDLHSPQAARDYAMELRRLLRLAGASEADMEKGQMRVEPNISITRRGSSEHGVKTELKNINSFRSLYRAVHYEINRQVRLVESGGVVTQETRGWSDSEGRTFPQRTKEFAEDYRYFPEPDLPPLTLDRAWIDLLKQEVMAAVANDLSEMRAVKDVRQRFNLARDTAERLVKVGLSNVLEEAIERGADGKATARFLISEVLPKLSDGWANQLSSHQIAQLVGLLEGRYINRENAIRILNVVWNTTLEPETVARERNLLGRVDDDVILNAIRLVLDTEPKAVSDYKAGKKEALGVLIRAVAEACGDRADRRRISELLRIALE
jgi:aspartyl-tRNA(Asn)/glutamyl-tRNA(Gln) amidotransferase subunit B